MQGALVVHLSGKRTGTKSYKSPDFCSTNFSFRKHLQGSRNFFYYSRPRLPSSYVLSTEGPVLRLVLPKLPLVPSLPPPVFPLRRTFPEFPHPHRRDLSDPSVTPKVEVGSEGSALGLRLSGDRDSGYTRPWYGLRPLVFPDCYRSLTSPERSRNH